MYIRFVNLRLIKFIYCCMQNRSKNCNSACKLQNLYTNQNIAIIHRSLYKGQNHTIVLCFENFLHLLTPVSLPQWFTGDLDSVVCVWN